jgi:NAD(P)-dependent dehydrogenase (short-subunit alcohol dehydrogenase family)
MSLQDLRGKTAIVTGAAGGIGFGIAGALADAGMNLVLCDLQPEKLEAARAAIEATGVAAIGVQVDVSDAESVAAAGRAAEARFDRVHVVVNNAGVAMHGSKLVDVTEDEWRWVLGVNVMGVIHGIRHLVPLVRRHGEGGHVVNTASISGFFVREGANQGAYSMSKYAVVALSEALEQELAGSGVGVSVLCPGPVNTNIFGSAATRPAQFGGAYAREAQEKLRDRVLQGGLQPAQVGRRVVQGMRDGAFYIVTHASELEAIAARHRRIEAAVAQAHAD